MLTERASVRGRDKPEVRLLSLRSSSDMISFTKNDDYFGIQRCDGFLEQVTSVDVMDRRAKVSKPGHVDSLSMPSSL